MNLIIGDESFRARWEPCSARSQAAFKRLAAEAVQMVHARWSGEACWTPLGSCDVDLEVENPTSTPAPGQILLYPGGVSETEILIPYGPTRFACVGGPLVGAHLVSLDGDLQRLAELGRRALWEGAMPIRWVF